MADFQVLLAPEAIRNIDAIHDWIAQRSPEGAARWHLRLDGALAQLKHDAERFSIAPESHHFHQTVRNLNFRMPSGRAYRLLFTIVGTDVHVLFVRAPGQNLVGP